MTIHKTYYRIIEIVWLIVAIMGAIACVHAFIRGGIYKDTLVFLVIVVVSVLMYFYRRNQRKKDK